MAKRGWKRKKKKKSEVSGTLTRRQLARRCNVAKRTKWTRRRERTDETKRKKERRKRRTKKE